MKKNLLNDNRAVRKYNMEVAVLKKVGDRTGCFFAVLLACPLSVFAAEGSKAPSTVPVWLCIPFAGLLLCIAVMPLVKAEWWESHQPLVVALWIILMVVPFAFVYGAGKTAETVLDCIVNDYLTFIILLFGLFCVSGNITMEGDFAGSPRVNVGLLALGTLLASCIGTTGASMLMVRPVIKMNSWRKRKGHIMIFFIFMISNMGGCLTPIGDPPLLMGFMRGVPFFWSLHLFPVLIFNMVILLFVFYQIDKRSYRKILQMAVNRISVNGYSVSSGWTAQYHFPCDDRWRGNFKRCTSGNVRIPGCCRQCKRHSSLWRSNPDIPGSDRNRDHSACCFSFL